MSPASTDVKIIDGYKMGCVAIFTDREDANKKAIFLRQKSFLVRVIPYGKRWKLYSTHHLLQFEHKRRPQK